MTLDASLPLPGRRSMQRTGLLATSMLAGLMGFASAAQADPLPVGGKVMAGSAAIASTAPGAMTITQSSARAVIDWTSFSVAQGKSVTFKQPDAKSATLNRVTGSTSSQIAGQIASNGAVYLVNPNGIALTSTASVNTAGGFIASTLDIADADFMAGNLKFVGSGASGSVVNGGSISAGQGAYVALLGGSVANDGVIVVPLGKVALASGESVALDLNGDQFMQVGVPTSALSQSRALVENSGKIAVAGGMAFLQAATAKDLVRNVINMSGTINADSATSSGGTVILQGGDGGTVSFTGTITARATGASGDGGFVETSGAHVAISGQTVDTTSLSGKSGNWLIDPTDFTVAASGGDLTGAALGSQLALTSVTIAAGTGASGTNGDVIVNDAVSWSSGNTLTLTAYRNVAINANLTAGGSGAGLVLRADNTGTGTGTVTFAAGKTATLGGSNSFARIYYNAATFGTATDFSGKVTAGKLTAYELVNTAAKLQAINNNLSENYALSKNIDASTITNFVPLGTNGTGGCAAAGCEFQGSFDGQGFTIDKLKITRGTAYYVGLFGSVGNNSGLTQTIANVNLTNVAIVGSSYTGALVGSNRSQWSGGVGADISNVSVTGTVTATANGAYNIGGVVGYSSGADLAGITSAVVVKSTPGSSIGGLVGYMDTGALTSSHATGSVTSTKVSGYQVSQMGGLAGYLSDVSIAGSDATGAVSSSAASAYYVGGLVGYMTCSSLCNLGIDQSFASGSVTVGAGSYGIGGFAGYANGLASITNSYATGAIAAGDSSSSLGGFIGIGYYLGSFSSDYATGAVTSGASASNTGGFIGYGSGINAITSSYATGPVTTGTSGSNIGGFAGYLDTSLISNSYAQGNVTTGLESVSVGGFLGYGSTNQLEAISASGTVTGSTNVGGLIGRHAQGLITASFATGAVVQIGSTGNNYTSVGGLIGSSDAELQNVYATGNISIGTGYVSYIGGLVGDLSGNIIVGYATGKVTGTANTDSVGGLVGRNNARSLIGVYATGAVVGGYAVGGLVGKNYGGGIDGAYATGSVSGANSVGGLVGAGGNDRILNSYAQGAVTGGVFASAVGGLVGQDDGVISNSFAAGAVTAGDGSSNIGGLVGNSTGLISDSYATGVVKSGASLNGVISMNIGGLVGGAYGSVTNAYATGAVSAGDGSTYVGGLVGYDNASLLNVRASGNVVVGTATIPATGYYVGGLVGFQSGTITNGYALGNVTVGGSSTYIGGLVGLSYASITSAYASGAVSAGSNSVDVGGLAGQLYSATITRAYALGNVTSGTGSTAVGGLVGELAYNANLNQTYAVGLVTGPAGATGGLVGQSDGNSRIVRSYWNTQTSGQASMCGVANGAGCTNAGGLTTAQMTDFNSYATTYAGWNFSTVWSPPSQVGQAGQTAAYYPQLYALTPVVVATPNAATRTYGSANPVFTGTISAGGPSRYAFDDAGDILSTGALFTSAASLTSNVGTYAIIPNASALSNNGVAYRVIMPTGALLTVTPAALTVTYTANAVSRVYGNANPALTGTTVASGLLNGDTLDTAVLGSATYGTAASSASNVGLYAVTGSGLTAKAGNYTVTFAQAAGNATALSVTPAALAIIYTANAGTRVYGAADPTYTGTVTAYGLVNGDTLGTVTSGTALFTTNATATSGVGTYAINGSGLAASSGNYLYVFGQAPGNTNKLTITPAALTLTYTADAASRLYGGVEPTYTGTISGSGFLNGDTVASATTGTATWTTNATIKSNIGSYAINGSGLTAANYTITTVQAAGNAKALTINPAPLTVSYKAAIVSRTYGSENPTFTGVALATGLVNGDTLAKVATGTLVFKSGATALTAVGKYAINGSGLKKINSNYTITYTQATSNALALTIVRAPLTLTYTADAVTRLYNTANPTLTGVVVGSGFVNGQDLTALAGKAVFKTTATKTSPVGSYAINGSGLASKNYAITIVQAPTNATALTVTN